MEQIWTTVEDLGPWGWLILGALLFVLETMIPGVFLMWFGSAAAVVGLILFAVALDWQMQLLLFSVLSVISVFVARMFSVNGVRRSDQPMLNERGAQLVGRIVVVTQAIRHGEGRVRVGDTEWPARGRDADVGAEVRIAEVKGTVLEVTAVETGPAVA